MYIYIYIYILVLCTTAATVRRAMAGSSSKCATLREYYITISLSYYIVILYIVIVYYITILLFHPIREMGGAPRNPAPRNHFLARIVKPAGCHCTDAFGGKRNRGVPTPLRSTSPFSGTSCHSRHGESGASWTTARSQLAAAPDGACTPT